ncbi:MAG: HAD family phosphatase [Pirellulales bacterium]
MNDCAHWRPPSQPLRGVVFDLDGLMFNTEELYEQVGGEILRRRGKIFTDELLHQMMGRQSPVALGLMIEYHGLSDTVEILAQESEVVFREVLDTQLATMPGLLELLDQLEAAEIPKAIATSSGRSFAHNVLGRFELSERFAFILTAEDIAHGKPRPDIYQQAAARLNLEPPQILVLEDSANGCRAGVAAGAYTVAVPAGRSRAHSFDGCAMVATSLADPRIYQALGLPRNVDTDR